MKYTYIELNGYKRFALNGFEHFSMIITSPLQLILGLNGSGKSSLLYECSPLPANGKDFSKEGSKVIHIEHDHNRYILTSNFALKNIHSFLLNDQELNPGGTVTIQKDLVKEHFGITNEIHELICGKELFTSMSFSRRKEWILKLCDTNFDYAIKVYNTFKERHRDITGALKLAKKALVLESEKLLQEEHLISLQTQANSIHECLNHLLEYRKPVEGDLTTLSFEHDRLDKQLYSLSRMLVDTNKRISSREFSSAEYAEKIEETSNEIVKTQTLITKISEDHSNNASKIAILQRTEGETADQLEFEREQIKQELQVLISSSILNKALDKLDTNVYSSFELLKHELLEIFSDMPDNGDGKYSSATSAVVKQELEAFETDKKKLSAFLNQTNAEIAHMYSHKDKNDATCPNCKHTFSLHYDESKYSGLIALCAKGDNELELLQNKINKHNTYLGDFNTYATLYRRYLALTKSTPTLSAYWDYLAKSEVALKNPKAAIHELQKIENDLLCQIKINNLMTRENEINKLLVLLRDVGTDDLNKLITTNLNLEIDLSLLTSTLQKLTKYKEWAQAELKLYSDLSSIRLKIREIITLKKRYTREEIEIVRRTIFNQLVRDLQSLLANTENTLATAAAQRSIVNDLSSRIEGYTKDEQALSLLIKQLSPTEGLIAEGLLGFIKNFVDRWNELIAAVWTYPLEIQSCDMVEGESVDLDYRFPMKIGEDEALSEDVSKGSTGMLEMINLSFRLIAMQYLNLKDAPLILDEWGASFDKEHRVSASLLIKSLIEQQTFSQMFIISHYLEQYGGLSNAEICVLNPNNIVVPKAYNRHVKML